MRTRGGRLREATWPRWYGNAAAIVALLIAALATTPAHALGPQLKLVPLSTAADGSVRLRAYIYSPVPLGAYTLQLSFNPTLLELVNIDGGGAEFASAPFSNPATFASGMVRFSAIQPARMDGPTGKCHVATFTLRPRVAKVRTRVQLEAIVVADTLGSTYQLPKRLKTVATRKR
jgi:hypothetical protein